MRDEVIARVRGELVVVDMANLVVGAYCPSVVSHVLSGVFALTKQVSDEVGSEKVSLFPRTRYRGLNIAWTVAVNLYFLIFQTTCTFSLSALSASSSRLCVPGRNSHQHENVISNQY
jgi:hypothetical protein